MNSPPFQLEAQRPVAVFPGQGVLPDREITAGARPDLVDALDRLLGHDAFTERAGTADAQPSIYCSSLALWSMRGDLDHRCFAGHSLGEITALAAAGWIDEMDGLRLVVRRGRLMEEACSSNPGGMIAILGVDAFSTVPFAEEQGLVLANANAPDQAVVAGRNEALDMLADHLTDQRVSFVRLPVSGAFHSSLMASAIGPFQEELSRMKLTPNSRIVFSSATLAPLRRLDDLAQGLVKPVRWRQALLALWSAGARTFVAYGPGRTLGSLVRRNLPEADVREAEGQPSLGPRTATAPAAPSASQT